jgi:hypothetical protein
MHVRRRLRIDLNRLAHAGGAIGPAVGDADRHAGKRFVGGEALNPCRFARTLRGQTCIVNAFSSDIYICFNVLKCSAP